jgi:aspartate kinase
MKILKFGGTSVGKPDRMQQVASLISAHKEKKIVVLSALSGTTNNLVEIGRLLFEKNKAEARIKVEELYTHHLNFSHDLLATEKKKTEAARILDRHFDFMRGLPENFFNKRLNNELLAQGELLSTQLFQLYLEEKNVNAILIPALDFMLIDEEKEPDIDYIKSNLKSILEANKSFEIFITQGYICRNHDGEIENLKRGGSDYSATLIGAAILAEEVQIWTDIDGMHNNDPRVVEKTYPIPELSFNEASELAYFGAKILHPSSIWPVQKFSVPVRLKNTMDPDAYGTLISSREEMKTIKAIAAKDGITAIKIKSTRMLMAYGFLRRVFQIFENYRTPIDMITTSEVAISLTIDDNSHLEVIKKEIGEFADVVIDENLTIICIVGNLIVEKEEILPKVFGALEAFPVRMISYGGSKYNISVLVDNKHKEAALKELNKYVFAL